MAARKPRKPRPPLDAATLDELALAYVGRFATTRSKLGTYLARKLRERGWGAEQPPDIEQLVERLAASGYVDDEAYALSKSRTLTARGYGPRRVGQALRAAGIDEEDSGDARELAQSQAVEAALRFARRRRIGPFGDGSGDRSARDKALAAMVRAGHAFSLSNAILRLEPGCEIDPTALEAQ